MKGLTLPIAMIMGLLLTGCSSLSTVGSTATQATHGYLARAQDQSWADYLVLTRDGNSLSGTVDTGTLSGQTVKTNHGALNGTTDGSSITLSTGVLGTNLTGSYQGNNVVLAIPQSNGTLESVPFVPSSQQNYNNLVNGMWQKANAAQVAAQSPTPTPSPAPKQAGAPVSYVQWWRCQSDSSDSGTVDHSADGDIAAEGGVPSVFCDQALKQKGLNPAANVYRVPVPNGPKQPVLYRANCPHPGWLVNIVGTASDSPPWDIPAADWGSFDQNWNPVDTGAC